VLRETLEEGMGDPSAPPPIAQRLELALLEPDPDDPSPPVKASTLADLSPLVNSERRPLLRALALLVQHHRAYGIAQYATGHRIAQPMFTLVDTP
jgi:hypothetical protein